MIKKLPKDEYDRPKKYRKHRNTTVGAPCKYCNVPISFWGAMRCKEIKK